MVCPYITNTKRTIEVNKTYTGAKETESNEIEKITVEATKCAQADCGAWYNGRCQYRG